MKKLAFMFGFIAWFKLNFYLKKVLRNKYDFHMELINDRWFPMQFLAFNVFVCRKND